MLLTVLSGGGGGFRGIVLLVDNLFVLGLNILKLEKVVIKVDCVINN